ncbi:MAG: elongation factor 4 [Spirochaetes bacterium GWD1_61_31]|nr:MAG: elongation factor 4 [Spirochaetes bacterium GWB1_60_80]OHD30136.1 MAG: elongation factor 4 [Spirochaetes bacterium GWC1_61_12]OHD34610.1 MAG: elongation factor 4 [Spirochaetes bacterium GWD1_61_31]OHD46426.1 MAG: elongation factor 4 [Spirochaetes bacterium GWE1_60_18]OHD59482.1 MAG: elongation factor 4 [Spirochaetes bacterium GWF1_60_12]HAW86100.1 elongation factor 4 [Spirochaetaceae bacterium]
MHDILRTRNFCIIAHIDHGKSTLADRFIERSKLVDARKMQHQMLDNMDIERERGITIKSQAVSLQYTANDGLTYTLNLVDTPGHVDFSYEVSRAISSCEGAILLVDATQGVEAQTLSNMYMALEHNLEIMPVINKIDMPAADIPEARHQISHELGLDGDTALCVSGKMGLGIDELFEAIVHSIPAPTGRPDKPLTALIFDSHYDPYRGVIVHIRVFDGVIKPGLRIRLMNNNSEYLVEDTGVFKLSLVQQEALTAGDVGYFIAGIKTVSDVRVGDTVTGADNPVASALPGFREVKPVVFSSIYPMDTADYADLKVAMEKLKLNDASLLYDKDSSAALGFGFRCGFLGMLHLEVVQERLEREYDQAIIMTAPSVSYHIFLNKGEMVVVDNPADYPDPSFIEHVEEPYIKAQIITPVAYIGNLIALCVNKRGVQKSFNHLDEKRVEMVFEMPLADVLFDFYDKLKSTSRGYASFDYEVIGYQPTELAKLDILINGKPVDALAQLVYRPNAQDRGRKVCDRLQGSMSRQQFKIAIQAAIGGTIVARETVNALRKDVLAKCYGGDISRKRKLLEKQKEGKKRMKMVGDVELTQESFMAVLREREDDDKQR